jgi:AraC family transcriptional regulator, transcriptional activator of pobA
MASFRSLLLDKVNVRTAGLHIITFAVHRHLPELLSVKPHQHGWSQALLYLEGFGEQLLAEGRARTEPGTLTLIPPQTIHAFSRQHGRTPLCVMIDFHLRDVRGKPPIVAALSRSELSQVKQSIAHLLRINPGGNEAVHLECAVHVLQILSVLLRAGGWNPRLPVSGTDVGASRLLDVLAGVKVDEPLALCVEKSGYQRDHLNRLLKKETGLTLGQWRAQRRLAKAKELLSAGVKVGEVALTTGIPDQNYFARWFRRQTGQSPSAWTHDRAG